MTADDAWDELSASLEDSEPPCNGLELFTAACLSEEDRAWCASICARCPIADPCDAYATAAKVTAGFWAGHFYTSKGKT